MCRNETCQHSLVGPDQKIFCSLRCSTSYNMSHRAGQICPHCNVLKKSRWHQHIKSCQKKIQEKARKEEENRKKQIKIIRKCIGCNNIFEVKYKSHKKKYCSSLCSNINRPISEKQRSVGRAAAKRNGGYQPRSGRGKHGIYKGYWCQSSWELAWVIYALENEIVFYRNYEEFNYVWNNKTKKYRPDFILDDGSYLEIKGYQTLEWEAKLKHFPHQIFCYYKEEMKPILKYVIQKYGKNFTELYKGV